MLSTNVSVGIFKLFNAAKNQRDVFNMKGIGLGLTITKKLVHSLDGEIALNSEERKGTDISITLPYFKIINDDDLPNEEFDIIVKFKENKNNMHFYTQQSPNEWGTFRKYNNQ